MDALNHILGTYVATGVNAPKRYPKKPKLQLVENRGKPLEMIDRKAYVKRMKELANGNHNR